MRNLQNLVIKDQYDSGGRCDETKGNLIKDLIIKTNAQLCVEIGVFKGSSLMYFVEALEITNGKVIGIDPYSLSAFENEIPNKSLNEHIYGVLFKKQIILDEIYEGVLRVINENRLENIVSLIRSKSEDYYNNLKIESVDIIHIDGNHDEEYVTKDIQLYLPLIKKEGYIIMDDITWPGVINSINNHLQDKSDLLQKYKDFAVYIKK